MNIEGLEDLFGYQLQHAYYVERAHVELLAEMADDASNDDVRDRFVTHRDRTETQIERLERVFGALGRRPRANRSGTADGLADSRRSPPDADDQIVPDDLERALLAERLEIRSYESLLRLAGRLAYADDIVEPLEANLAEEREALAELEDLEDEVAIEELLRPGA
ncbi:ferritin-like domain-containing protein [Natrarchaeobius sp. A-rgal3]|uniref:YciE/YciF ferroxidase family protein n=1 Tax=Natrarchaeobius versutus TaxID=1679078 RepID=UPI00350EC082